MPAEGRAVRRRSALTAAVAIVASIPMTAPALPSTGHPSRAAAATAARRLPVGGTAFWSGPGAAPDSCDGAATFCWDDALDVAPRGHRLRVAVDHATVGDVFRLTVTEPDGSMHVTSPGDGLYSAELLVDGPAAGRWQVRVEAGSEARDRRYRVRAKLEPAPARPRHVLVYPNLQVLPPYDFTFDMPLTNGSTGGAPQGVPAPGGRASCHAEEVAEERAVRCLRMAFGVRNTGQGPMQLFYRNASTPHEDRPLFQRVRYADGGYVDRPAGTARFHHSHAHFHHDAAVALRLYQVTDRTRGTLEPAGAEHRKGFAHRSELLREWTRFYPTWPRDGFGLDAGWGDYYEWDRPGNYLDLGLRGDGYYLIRMVADPTNGVAESNERDNVGYSYLRIAGASVELIESGRGASPWDRCKIVMPFGAEPEAPRGRRPARPRDCPPDTT